MEQRLTWPSCQDLRGEKDFPTLSSIPSFIHSLGFGLGSGATNIDKTQTLASGCMHGPAAVDPCKQKQSHMQHNTCSKKTSHWGSGEEMLRIQKSEEHKSTPTRSEIKKEMPKQEMEYNIGQIRARKQSGEADG